MTTEATVTPLWSKIENPPLLWRPLASYYLLLASTACCWVSASSWCGRRRTWCRRMCRSRSCRSSCCGSAIGLPLMLVATRLPVRAIERSAYPALLGALVLLVAVLVPGLSVSAERRHSVGQRRRSVHDSAVGVRQARAGAVGRGFARPQAKVRHARHLPAHADTAACRSP